MGAEVLDRLAVDFKSVQTEVNNNDNNNNK